MLNFSYFCPQLTKSPECRDCKVFATDAILATLMTCARSKYSWDIVVYREGGYLFFDKRDASQFGEWRMMGTLLTHWCIVITVKVNFYVCT